MSLVMGILEKDFFVLCADTQLNKPDGTKELIDKIIKINDNIILGMGGQVEAALNIITQANHYSNYESASFLHYDRILTSIFCSYHESGTPLGDVTLLVGGIEKDILYFRVLSILHGELAECELYQYNGTSIRKLANNANHLPNIIECVVKPDYTPESIITGFQEVLNRGVEFDDSINNIMTYYLLRR